MAITEIIALLSAMVLSLTFVPGDLDLVGNGVSANTGADSKPQDFGASVPGRT
jgi:Cu/Ag efflux pump CusA